MTSSLQDSATRNRSNSGEDTGLPEHDRKRPRLSEGTSDVDQHFPDLKSAPDESDIRSQSILTPVASPQQSPKLALPPHSADASMVAPSPTSKVTINTRPISSQSAPYNPSIPSENEISATKTADDLHAQSPQVSRANGPPTSASETISVSSSPTGSPEIEVAEVEDFDQDPSQTRWTKRIGASGATRTILPSHVRTSFPLVADYKAGETRLAVNRIAKILADPVRDPGQTFQAVKEWLVDFVSSCDNLTEAIVEEESGFWARLHVIPESLLKRDQRTATSVGCQDLIDFFVAYGQITKMMFDLETKKFLEISESDQKLDVTCTAIAWSYLTSIPWILTPNCSLLASLQRYHGLDPMLIIQPCCHRLMDPTQINLMESITNLITALGGALVKSSKFFKDPSVFTNPLVSLVDVLTLAPESMTATNSHTIHAMESIRSGLARICFGLDKLLQDSIKKQCPWLNMDVAMDMLGKLTPMFSKLGSEVPQFGKDVIASAGVAFDDADFTYLDAIVGYAWKFSMYYKFLRYGRMELRVCGVERMSNELVNAYNYWIREKTNGHQEPTVKFLNRFLRENEVIPYVISVDSHPQILQRSANLVGFLSVSRTYAPSDTDYIWQTVMGSQDPRTAQEILALMQKCFDIFQEEQLYYICQKVVEIPRDRVDVRYLEFGLAALAALRTKSHHHSLSHYFNPMPTYEPVSRELCLHLLRVVGTPSLQPEYWIQIQADLMEYLLYFLHASGEPSRCFAISLEEEQTIMADLRADLAAHSMYTPGAMAIVNCMLSMKFLGLNAKLLIIQRCGLPKALTDEFAMWSGNGQGTPPSMLWQIEAPLNCLSFLLVYVPDEFDDTLVSTLWTTLLTGQSIDPQIRLRAWSQLITIIKQCKQPNAVIDRILYDHWARLQPTDFSKAVLDFAEQSISYECQTRDQPIPTPGQVIEIPGIDRVWEIMLNTPSGTFEMEATDFVINQYLRNSRIKSASRNSIRVTHLALIDKCIELVRGSASKLKSFAESETQSDGDDGMVIIATPAEIRLEESRFDRSLLFLRRFTEAVKGNPACSPIASRQSDGILEFSGQKGQHIEFRVQVFGNKFVTEDQRSVSFGNANTGAELWRYLSAISGFENFTIINDGKPRTDLRDECSTLEDLKIIRGALIVKRAAESEAHNPQASLNQSSPVDEKIMQHFDHMYNLLESDNRLAKEVYDFLNITSVRQKVSEIARSMITPASELLPAGKPYKLLFCVQALRSPVEVESLGNDPDSAFLAYAVDAITTALTKLGENSFHHALQQQIAYELLDTLQIAFRAKVSGEVSNQYLRNHESFSALILQYLGSVLQASSAPDRVQQPEKMIRAAFEVLIESRLQNESAWKTLDTNSVLSTILGQALLYDGREKVRQSLVEVLLSLTGVVAPKFQFKPLDGRAFRARYDSTTIESCLMQIWDVFLALLPQAKEHGTRCQEFFDAALAILRRIGKSFEVDSLRTLCEEWSNAFCCMKITSVASAIQAYAKDYLNIALSPLSQSDQLSTSSAPLLESEVREGLYELLVLICQSQNEVNIIVSELSDDLLAQDQFEPSQGHERLALRSDVGYAGLRNLSNTCYLNSLFSQLFMNVQFRQLVLKAPIVDQKQQKLLWELAKVFAHMQDSYEKSIEPTSAVDSIITYDGDNIDVTVQMDVDEFFNLLFDRLEGQIVDPNLKSYFKSLYGGQTIQQIKSKECEHVSERPEAFAVLPIEIKGLFGLEESLKAYVEGEMLQGDNKYSCTSCGKFVDAVKRSCLKEVPDNLIFNLKRFDYDIMTGLRCKLNDQFVFPEILDMAPYTLEHLSQPDRPLESDYFELTGVIVHSGTADSGHYFSYIRQRPCAREKHYSWVQFNDSDVTAFDPAHIQDNCFGGADASWNNLLKFYNAYMLFYQRKSSIQRIEQQFMHTDPFNPFRLRNPANVQDYIEKENELFLRSYCAQDPAHAKFVRQLVEKLWETGGGQCSEDHAVENRTLRMALSYMHSVSSRWKNQPEMDTTAKLINKYSRRCEHCALIMVQFFASDQILVESIVKSPYQATRKLFHNMARTSVHELRAKMAESPASELSQDYERSLYRIVKHLRIAWDTISRTARCWSEYFGLLTDIVDLGKEEAQMVMDVGFPGLCFELIHVHYVDAHEFRIERRLRQQYAPYLALRERNRPFNHQALMQFFSQMLFCLDLSIWPTGNQRPVSASSKQIGPTALEVEMLGLAVSPHNFDWLKRMIAGRAAATVVDNIVAFLASDRQLAGAVSGMIVSGLDHKSMQVAAAFLSPMVIFCAKCGSMNQISDLVGRFAESVPTIGLEYGREYAAAIKNLLTIDNDNLDVESGFLREAMVEQIHHWAPVLLVASNEMGYDVRGEALQIVNVLLLDRMDEAQEDDLVQYRQYQQKAFQLAKSAAEYVQTAFLNTNAGENHHLQHGHATRVVQAVSRCVANIELETTQEEQQMEDIKRVMMELKGRADNAVETLSAEWQESSEVDALSDDFEDLTSP